MTGVEVRRTRSLCPSCGGLVPARIVENGAGLLLVRECPRDGTETRPFSPDRRFWESLQPWLDRNNERRAPDDFLGTRCHVDVARDLYIDLTERCNLRCPICYTNAGARPSRDLTLEEIEAAIESLGPRRPVVSLLGGEPTLREDLPEIVSLLARRGFLVKLITNGTRLDDEGYLARLREAGLRWVILSFDGFSEEIYRRLRGRPMLDLKLRVIDKLARHGFWTIFASMIVRGVNTEEVGKILDFALRAPGVVQIGFLPSSRMGRSEVEEGIADLSVPEFMDLLADQTGGAVTRADFLRAMRFGKLYTALTGNLAYKPRTCVFGVFLVRTRGRIVPIERAIGPGFLAGHPASALDVARALGAIPRWNRAPLHPNLFGIVIEKFRDREAMDWDDAKNCTKVYLTRDGFIPNCIYNARYRAEHF